MSAAKAVKGPKGPKSATSQISKSEAKNAATQEQLRIAQLINEKQASEADIKEKVDQIVDMTGRDENDVLIALHDTGYEVEAAFERLMENSNQGEWHETKSKKQKKNKNENEVLNERNDKGTNGSATAGEDWDAKPERSSAPRGRRNDKAPPRFQRARARNQNEDDRGGDKGRGRGRGGRGGGRGRGRGGGRRDANGFRSGFDGGPEIDTWTNDVATNKENVQSGFGTWGDTSEDWGADEWTGSLDESKVFTPTVPIESKLNDGGASFTGDNDAQMFSVSNIETQVFSNSGTGFGNSTFQDTQQSPQKLGERLDINVLLGSGKAAGAPDTVSGGGTGELTPQTANFISQYTKQTNEFNKAATESIKNAVGIGHTNSSHQPAVSTDMASSQAMAGAVQASKLKKAKQPPPSKIPSSAVVMPGGSMHYGGLDVQFGNWEKEDSFSFNNAPVNTANSVPVPNQRTVNSGQSSGGAGQMDSANSSQQTSQSVSSLFDSMNQQGQQGKPVMPPYGKSLQPNVALQQTNMISNKDVLQYSGQMDRKSPYQTSGSLQQSDMSGSSQLYTQQQQQQSLSGSFSSSTSENHSSAPATHSSLYPPPGVSQGLQNYSSSSFQSSSGSASGGHVYGQQQQKLDGSMQHHASSAQANTGSYGGQGSSGYGSSSYQPAAGSAFGSSASRDSQSNSSYPGAASQSFSHSLNQPSANSYGSRDLSESQYGSTGYSSGAQPSLNAKLEKMSLKENSTESQHSYDSSSMTMGSSMAPVASSHTVVASSQSLSASGINSLATPSVTAASSSLSSSVGAAGASSSRTSVGSGKAPPNLPQGVPPMMNQSYIMGQPGLSGFPLAAFGLQQPVYGYDDALYSQLTGRLPMQQSYYDNLAAFQPTPPTTIAGMDAGKMGAGMPMGMSGLDTVKSPAMSQQQVGAGSTSQRSESPIGGSAAAAANLAQPSVTQSITASPAAAAQQQFINANYPQGYYNFYAPMPNNYYTPGAPMMPFGNHMMPTVTNTNTNQTNSQHAGQYPKASLGSYGYGGGQSQDYKGYGGSQQSQGVKAAMGGSLNSSGAEISAASMATYPKAPNQSAHNFGHSGSAFDKLSNSNPAAFANLAGLTGNMAGSLHSQMPPYMPNLPFMPNIHQQGSTGQMLPHALHQDGTSAGSRGQNAGQQKSVTGKGAFQPYWNN